MSRSFERAKAFRDGKSVEVFRIRCGKCNAFDDWKRAQGNFNCGADHPGIAKHFHSIGWAVGGGPRADRCPRCMEAKPAEPAPNVVPLIKKGEPVLQPEKPRDMTREDRRVILAKLNEVYLDEQRGYDRGWTDHRVSIDLGCPRAWVAQLRDENFGPARDNEDVREFMAKVRAVGEEARAIEKATAELKLRADRMGDDMRRLERVATDVAKQTGTAA